MKGRDTHPFQELRLPHQTLQLASLSKEGTVTHNACVLFFAASVFVYVVFVYLVKELELQEVNRG